MVWVSRMLSYVQMFRDLCPRELPIFPASDPSFIRVVTDTEEGFGAQHTQKPILQSQFLRKVKAFMAKLTHKETGGKANLSTAWSGFGLHLKEKAREAGHLL